MWIFNFNFIRWAGKQFRGNSSKNIVQVGLFITEFFLLCDYVKSGNENLNILTSAKRYKLRIDLADFNGNTRYAEYDNFVVNSAADKYRLSLIGAYSGTAGNWSACFL